MDPSLTLSLLLQVDAVPAPQRPLTLLPPLLPLPPLPPLLPLLLPHLVLEDDLARPILLPTSPHFHWVLAFLFLPVSNPVPGLGSVDVAPAGSVVVGKEVVLRVDGLHPSFNV